MADAKLASIGAALLELIRAYRQWSYPNPFLVKRFIRSAAPAIHPAKEKVCVDLGAGTAPYKSVLIKHFQLTKYLAVDIAPSNMTDVVADAKQLPFPENSVDLVVSFDVVQHIGMVGNVFDEMKRILRPGGAVLMSFPFMYSECDFRDYYRWTMEGMGAELACRGFTVVRERKRGGLLYAQACLLLWLAQHSLPGGRGGWRSKRSPLTVFRYAIVTLVSLPFVIVAWLALGLDRVLPSSDCYMGGLVYAQLTKEAC